LQRLSSEEIGRPDRNERGFLLTLCGAMNKIQTDKKVERWMMDGKQRKGAYLISHRKGDAIVDVK